MMFDAAETASIGRDGAMPGARRADVRSLGGANPIDFRLPRAVSSVG